MEKQFDVTISIPLRLHNAKTMQEAESVAKEWASTLCDVLKGSSAYNEAEQPTIKIRHGDSLYETCPACGNICAEVEYTHDEGNEQEQRVCVNCHGDMLDSGEITTCERCGRNFHASRLIDNPANGEKEICPYCGKVWCE